MPHSRRPGKGFATEGPGSPGPSCSLVRSVSCRDRGTKATEAIVQPNGDHVHILANPVAEEGNATG